MVLRREYFLLRWRKFIISSHLFIVLTLIFEILGDFMMYSFHKTTWTY